MDIKSWRTNQQAQGLPASSNDFYMSVNKCPACKGNISEKKCGYCRGEGTYSSYMATVSVQPIEAYRKSRQKAEQLWKMLTAQQKKNTELLKEIEALKATQIPNAEKVSILITSLDRELSTIAVPAKSQAALAKLQVFMSELKENLYGSANE
jgi:hypothetical protein